MNEVEFETELEKININYTKDLKRKLATYCDFLIEYNKTTNLTSITERESIYLKHFLDSLLLLQYVEIKEGSIVLDFGTGAGFPGMILAIFNPNVNFVLMDSVGKKTKFLELLVEKIGLTNVTIINDRVEQHAALNREKYDYVVVRAVASLNILIELSAGLLKKRGLLIALKANIEEELKNSVKAASKTGLKLQSVNAFKLPKEESSRNIVIYEKENQTPQKYPREFGKIKKNSL